MPFSASDTSFPFQSTHPCAGCDRSRGACCWRARYISIHAPLCGVRHRRWACPFYRYDISIHAPLCGVRQVFWHYSAGGNHISIHAPLCGVRPMPTAIAAFTSTFQSTHPCAGCDCIFCHVNPPYQISIHAPLCGVRHGACTVLSSFGFISTHAPLCGVRPARTATS